MQIIDGVLERNDININANGGTEMIAEEMVRRIPKETLEGFQIIHSRPNYHELSDDHKKILVCHDLPGDPEIAHLKDGGWEKYDKLVFVSNWQLQMYNAFLGVPYSHSYVMKNAINPIIEDFDDDGLMANKMHQTDKIKLIYHTTPHRGLEILFPVFDFLSKEYDNLELDVYSSFAIYGWEQRDEPYKQLFDDLNDHPNINYHGYQPNDVVRKSLAEAHIFAYPSIWQETSCIALIEAMSAGCVCVHPNLAALPETSAGFTNMYQWHENKQEHTSIFYNILKQSIEILSKNLFAMNNQVSYTNSIYTWENREKEWNSLLQVM